MKFRTCLFHEVNSSFPLHVSKEVRRREVSHRKVGYCGAPFIRGSGALPAASRTVTGYRDGGWCGAAFIHSCGDPPAACRTMMCYRIELCVFP